MHSLFFYSYLKRLKQSIKINNTYRLFKETLSEVPYGSLLGLILFNIFTDDLFLWLTSATLHNFTGNSAILDFSNDLLELKPRRV